MPEQKELMKNKEYGGTMRLGDYTTVLKRGTIAKKAYDSDAVVERHRHRYEVSPEYINNLQDAGMIFSGTSPDGALMEIAELSKKEHPFMIGTQFHPELIARPLKPQPLFTAFMKAVRSEKKAR
jgi:CTP synthase